MEEHLTLKEAAQRLKVREKTVRRWIQSGALRATKAGKLWRIPESALDEFLEGPTRGPDKK